MISTITTTARALGAEQLGALGTDATVRDIESAAWADRDAARKRRGTLQRYRDLVWRDHVLGQSSPEREAEMANPVLAEIDGLTRRIVLCALAIDWVAANKYHPDALAKTRAAIEAHAAEAVPA